MIQLLDIKNRDIAEKVLQVQIPAYKVEAKMMNFYDIPPLHETVDSLIATTEIFYGYWDEGKIAGVISIEAENQSLHICRLIVHPNSFRKGIGRQLVQYIFEKYGDVETFAVSTGDLNTPAKKLYTILGFHETKKVEISPNVFIACFEKG